jgi:hypothetical protein
MIIGTSASNEVKVYVNTSTQTYEIYIQNTSAVTVEVEIYHRASTIDDDYSTVAAGAIVETGLAKIYDSSTTTDFIVKSAAIGIGTTSPVAKLHIHGDLPQLRLSDDAANNPSWSFQGSGGAGEAMDLKYRRDDGAQSRLFLVGGEHADDAYKGWTFNTHNGTNALRIDKDGNVGIGTTSPGQRLVVAKTDNVATTPVMELMVDTTFDNPTSNPSLYRLLDFSTNGGGGKRHCSINLLNYNNSGSGQYNITDRLKTGLGFSVRNGGSVTENVLSIHYNGNVGIGTTSPNMQLDCYVGATAYAGMQVRSSSGAFAKLIANPAAGGHNSIVRAGDLGIVFSTDNNAASNEVGKGFYIAPWAAATSGIRIDENGRVGIGTATPYSILDSFGGGITQRHTGNITPWSGSIVSAPNAGITIGQTGYAITGGSAMYWNLALWSNHNLHISSRGKSTAYITGNITGGSLNFTGQHRTFIKDVSFTQAIDLEGLIVSADQNKYIKMSGGIGAGSNAITTNESLPIVSISTKVNDKKCFGVISTSEDPETREDAYGRYVSIIPKENGDTRVYINSVGEGALWVTNINGSLESGDYITTSSVAGYGQKQDGAGLMNYTVAKITMDCDFSPVTQPIQNIKKELQDVNYWFKMRYDTITEAEFSNCTSESRRTVTGTVYTDENGEINTEQYNSLEPDVQSTYTELTRTIYQSVERESFKTEKDGYEHEVRNESVNVLDEHEQIQFEDDPTETEKAYKIRYLDANGVITDEANAVHTAAFVGCTYHCG